jgi:hypothetical protein
MPIHNELLAAHQPASSRHLPHIAYPGKRRRARRWGVLPPGWLRRPGGGTAGAGTLDGRRLPGDRVRWAAEGAVRCVRRSGRA